MLTLNSIRIRNFRAIKELTFRPQEEGITGIFGPNGAGKTSILTAVMFALYGVRPKDITVGALRRTGSEGEECSVSVVFTHLGQKVEVIRELTGKTNTVVANIYVDGQPETTTKPTAADRWIVRRLGVEAEGFLTAFVVRQKELDAFVRAVPSERKRIIEKLAGVETINNALKAAREDEKDSRKTVDLLPGSQEQVDVAAKEVDFYNNEAEEAKFELDTVKTTLTALSEERTSLLTIVENHRNQELKLERASNRATQLKNDIPDLEAQIQRVSYVKEIKEQESVDSLREQYQTITATLNDLRSGYAKAEHSRSYLQEQITDLTALIENEDERIQAAQKELDFSAEETAEKINRQEETLTTLKEQISQLLAQNSDLKESLEALHDNDECPTCKTHLADPEKLRNQFREIIQKNNTILESKKQEVETEQGKLTALRQQEKKHADLQFLITTRQNNITQLGTAKQSFAEQPDLPVLLAQIEETEKEQQRIVDLGSKARTLHEDRQLHTSLTQKKEETELLLQEVEKEIAELSQGFNTKAVKTAQKKVEETNYQYERLTTQARDLTAKLTEAQVRFQTARNTYQRAYEQWEKKKTLQEAHASKTLTTDMLEKFRQEVVSSIAPEISEYATSLISQMTDGYFTEIKLNDDFKASVVDSSGNELSVSWLSGGEESAVALALRLAVSFLITGGNPELLWLDEPLTAQDKDRRASILSMIRELPIKQILLINHAQEAQDIVDHEITLVKE